MSFEEQRAKRRATAVLAGRKLNADALVGIGHALSKTRVNPMAVKGTDDNREDWLLLQIPYLLDLAWWAMYELQDAQSVPIQESDGETK